MKKTIKILIYLFIILIAITTYFFITTTLIKNKEVKNSKENVGFLDAENKKEKDEDLFVVAGEAICLPVKDLDKLHDDLCILGIKGENDDYYRLQTISDDKHNVVNRLNEGEKIEISGTYINEVSETHKTLGTIKVTAIRHLDIENDDRVYNLPDSFKVDYISFKNYSSGIYKIEDYKMPGLTVVKGEIECQQTELGSSLLRTIKKEINGKKYCIMFSSEGAAESVYTGYAYTTVMGDNVYLAIFGAQYLNCSNYPEEERIKCDTERENFDLDVLVDQEIERMKI